jgi:hypothetical protein
MAYVKLKGKRNTLSGNGTGCVIWLSGVGTTLGARSCVFSNRDRDPDRLEGIFSISVSALLEFSGGGALAASAAGSTVSASPSKKRVIAICAFH